MQNSQFGSKIKNGKKWRKRLCDHFKNVECKKPLQKTPNIGQTRAFSKWPKLATMPMQNDQFGSKNSSKKHIKFEKREHFHKGQNLPRCMGYSPSKMISFCQRLKTLKRYEKRLCEHFKNVVCKKPLQKTPNIRKMRAFS